MTQFGLGRKFAEDERDLRFTVSSHLDQIPMGEFKRTYRYWNDAGWWGNQGSTPQCVAYAWTHWLEDGPTTQPVTPHGGTESIIKPADLYHDAQKVDEWPGEDYDGTSVRAGAKVLKSLGFISEYRWAWTLDDVINSVLAAGPVVVGTNWYQGMFDADDLGFIDVEGPVVGGHAYVLNGVNTKREIFRIKNSWGRDWGYNGHALLTFDDFDNLLRMDGEACLAIEIKK